MKKTVSKIHSKFFNTFFIVISLLALLPLWLSYGITLETIKLNDVTINQVSIKLDKKLHATIKEIDIHPKESDSALSADRVLEVFEWINWFLKSVETIDVSHLNYKSHIMSVHFEKNKFLLKHPKFTLKTSFTTINPDIIIDIDNFTYPEYNLGIQGKIYFNPKNFAYQGRFLTQSNFHQSNFTFEGNKKNIHLSTTQSKFFYEPYTGDFVLDGKLNLQTYDASLSGKLEVADILTKIEVQKRADIVHLNLYDAQIESLKYLVEILEIDEEIKPWLHGNILAKNYTLHSLYLPFDIQSKKPLLEELELSALLTNASVKFNPTLQAAKAEEISLQITQGTLLAQANNANFNMTPIEVNASISNLFDGAYLNVDVITQSKLDNTIHKLLSGYGITLNEFTQNKGTNLSKFFLQLPLASNIDQKLKIELKTDTNSTNLDVYGVPLELHHAKVHLLDQIITLENSAFSLAPYIDINISRARLDMKLRKLNALLHIDKATIGGDNLFNLHDIDAHLDVTYHNGVKVTIPEFSTTLRYKNDKLDMKIEDIKPLLPFSPLMQLFNIEDGEIRFSYENEKIIATSFIKGKSHTLSQNGKAFNNYFLTFKHENSSNYLSINNTIFVNTIDNNIQINYENLDVHLLKLYNRYSDNTKRREFISKQYASEKSKSIPSIHLYAKNSKFYYGDRILPSDNYSLYLKEPYLTFNLDHGITHIELNKVSDQVTLKANNIDKEFVKSFFKFNMQKGSINLLATGSTHDNEFYGMLTLKDTTLKGYSLVNNIIAFVNTVPSLITLNNPGFDKEGVTIKNGVIEYYITPEKLFIKSIRLIGSNTDIFGFGEIDLANKTINLTLTLSTVKGLSNLLSKIPLVGYVLLGEDQSIGTIIKVEGDLNDPIVSSSFGSDAILYPFSLIKRAIEWPLKLFEEEE
jgi:hypothetical protein